MENLKKKSESVEKTTDVSNQSPTVTHIVERLVDKLQSSSSLDDRCETNAVDEHHHHHHESLDIEKLENSSSAKLQLNNSNEDDLNEDYLLGIYPYLLIDDVMQIRDRYETNSVDEYLHHHHESLDTERLENSSSPELQLNNSNGDDLNEDCLLEIFSYLSIDDMMRVKKVSKKWYKACQQWFKQIQYLVYNEERFGERTLNLYKKKYCNSKIYGKPVRDDTYNNIMSILQSCGDHIKYYEATLRIRTMGEPKPYPIKNRQKFILQWIPKLCKNIVDVSIYAQKPSFSPSDFEIMATHWKKLKKINITYFPVSEDFGSKLLMLHNQQTLAFIRAKVSRCNYD